MGSSNGIKIKKPAYTKDTELYKIERIPKVFIPVSEGYTVTVGEGDRVLVGQLLGIALGHQVPLHCSVSGTVVGCVSIDSKEYIEINNDGKYELCSDIAPCEKRLSQMSAEEMTDRIRLCGIHDWKRISDAKGKALRFAVNCLDSDPYSCDKKTAVANYTKEIVGGAKIILKILGLQLCELVIDRHNTEEINMLIDCIGESKLFDIIDTKGKYPLGEKQRIITHLPNTEELDESSLFVLDVHSTAAVYRAFSQGMPYVRRTVSVGGSAALEDGCYDIPLGTPIKYISDQCVDRELTPEFSCVVGGVMKGTLSEGSNALVCEGTHTVTFMETHELNVRVGACIGCGKCDRACPEKLLPSVFISEHEKDFNYAIDASGMDYCTNCGACSYVCPASIPICEVADGDTSILSPERRYKKRKKEKAPFISHPESVRSINFDVILALVILLSWSVCCFGLKALIVACISVGTAVLSELLFNLLTKSGAFGVLNLSSVSCGLLVALTLSVELPLYVSAICAFFSVMLLRGAFGGNGKNLLHSAFGARVLASLFFHDAFVYTEHKYTLFDYIIGNTEGALGETSLILLCSVFAYLSLRRVISVITPAAIISTFAIVSFLCAPASNAVDTVKIMLIGTPIVFVSVFCGVEYSTIPKSAIGKVAYGALLGAIAAVIGRYTSYEGAYIAALIASVITPLFNRMHDADTEPLDFDESANAPIYFENIGNEAEEAQEYSDISEQDYGEEALSEPQIEVEGMPSEDEQAADDETSVFDNFTLEAFSDTSADRETSEESERLDSLDFSQTMDFSDAKADELLDLLSKEIGISLAEQNADAAKQKSTDSTEVDGEAAKKKAEILNDKGASSADEGATKDEQKPALDSTAMFNILYNETDDDV